MDTPCYIPKNVMDSFMQGFNGSSCFFVADKCNTSYSGIDLGLLGTPTEMDRIAMAFENIGKSAVMPCAEVSTSVRVRISVFDEVEFFVCAKNCGDTPRISEVFRTAQPNEMSFPSLSNPEPSWLVLPIPEPGPCF